MANNFKLFLKKAISMDKQILNLSMFPCRLVESSWAREQVIVGLGTQEAHLMYKYI